MGEYAVLNPHAEAILIAIDKFITVSIKSSDNYELSSSYGHFKWILNEVKEPQFLYDSLPHAKSAIFIAHRYLNFLEIPVDTYSIEINSELNHTDGRKYGLGSSGAVLIGILKAILYHHGVIVGKQQLFKLCVLAQLEINDLTSGAELATSIYTGWISYKRYDTLWLLNNKGLMMELINQQWPNLAINRLKINNMRPCVCYTGVDQSTKDYVAKINAKSNNSKFYEEFVKDASKTVNQLKNALINHDFLTINQTFNHYRQLIQNLQQWADITIESNDFVKILDAALECNISAKISGAGNGDCAIALVGSDIAYQRLAKVWQELNYHVLDVNVWEGFY